MRLGTTRLQSMYPVLDAISTPRLTALRGRNLELSRNSGGRRSSRFGLDDVHREMHEPCTGFARSYSPEPEFQRARVRARAYTCIYEVISAYESL